MLAGLRPETLGAPAVPARRADQAARSARSPARPGLRSPARPRARTSASSPARASAGFLAAPRRPRRPRRARSSTRRGAVARRATPATTTSRSASAAASASPRPSRSTCSRPMRRQPRRRRPRGAARDRDASRIRDAVLHRARRPGRTRPAPLPLAADRLPRRRRRRAVGRAPRALELELDAPPAAVAPGQTAVPAATAIWSSATARSPDSSRRGYALALAAVNSDADPRDLSVVLRGARAPARALGVADPCRRRHLDVLLTTAGMQPFKPYFLGRETAAGAAADLLPALLPHPRHRGGRQHRPPPHLLRDARQLRASATTSRRRRSRFAWELSLERLRLRPGADLGHRLRRRRGARARARRRRRSSSGRRIGVPEERIVPLPRSENFWQAGADRALRPLLGALHRPRRASSAAPTTGPATTAIASSSTGTSSS